MTSSKILGIKVLDFVKGDFTSQVQVSRETLANEVCADTVSIGDWVLVAFPGKRSVKHFVGNVISKCDALEEVYVKFLCYDADTRKFHWSFHEDETFSFDFSCVILG